MTKEVEKAQPYIDFVLRGATDHHVQLSAMADVKANMLLTVSMLVITFTAPNAWEGDMAWAARIMCLACIGTVILAAYATMPKLSLRPDRASPNPKAKGFNIFFFGDFARLNYDAFRDEMVDILNNPADTYEAKIRELYTMGAFLAAKKYRYIRLAYLTFIIGLLVAGAAGIVGMLGSGDEATTP